MRAIAISLFILILCGTYEILDAVEAQYQAETGGQVLFKGYRSTANVNATKDSSNDIRNISETYGLISAPKQGEASAWLPQTAAIVASLGAVVSVLFNATLGFGSFLNSILPWKLPDAVTNLLTTVLLFNHLLAVISILRGMNIGPD